MRTYFKILILAISILLGMPAFFAGRSAAEARAWPPDPVTDLIAEGMARNSDLESRAARVESLEREARAAGAPDDPRIGFGVVNLPVDSFSFQQEPMTQKQASISQKIPWPGKLSLQHRKALAAAVKEKAGLYAFKRELATKIAETYYDWAFTNRRLEINEQLMELARRLLEGTEKRYSVGKGLQQDVLQAQVELSRLLDENIVLRQELNALANELHSLLNREDFTHIPPITTNELPGPILDAARLRQKAMQHNPELIIRKAVIRIAEVDVELARKDFYPDFDVKLAYGQRDKDRMGNDLTDFLSASVMVTIPIRQHRKQAPHLDAAKRMLDAAKSSYRGKADTLPFEIDARVEHIALIRRNYHLYEKGLLVQARQWAQAAQSAYSVDEIEFNTMINARLRLLRFQIQQEKYRYELYKQIAFLENIVGGTVIRAHISENLEKTP
ncbi:MAG: TolC family protein [Desulfobacterales bacterium]